jgi:cytochrome c oxidase cbb3-type subunit III
MPMSGKRDDLLDHDADGIREFDNDLPRWWLYGFYVTIVFSALYLVNFHVLAQPIVGAPSIRAEYEADIRAAESAKAAAGVARPAAALTALTDAASIEKGRVTFESPTSICSSCHRPDLGGLVGPNLTDAMWLHGCSVAEVTTSIRTGYPLKGMLPFGGGAPLNDEQLRQLASYVLSKRGSSPPAPKAVDPERDKPCT